jgi:serine/threonine protein kinase
MSSCRSLYSCIQVVGVTKGLQYLHSKAVIHGDLKPVRFQLLSIPDCRARLSHHPDKHPYWWWWWSLLGDFGRCRIAGHRGSTTLAFAATGYQAPELIGARRSADTNEAPSNESYTNREIFHDKLTTKTDVFAYAMVSLEVSAEILT